MKRDAGAALILFLSSILPVIIAAAIVMVEVNEYIAEQARWQRVYDSALIEGGRLIDTPEKAINVVEGYLELQGVSGDVQFNRERSELSISSGERTFPLRLSKFFSNYTLRSEVGFRLGVRSNAALAPVDRVLVIDLAGAPSGVAERRDSTSDDFFRTNQRSFAEWSPQELTENCLSLDLLRFKAAIARFIDRQTFSQRERFGLILSSPEIGGIKIVDQSTPLQKRGAEKSFEYTRVAFEAKSLACATAIEHGSSKIAQEYRRYWEDPYFRWFTDNKSGEWRTGYSVAEVPIKDLLLAQPGHDEEGGSVGRLIEEAGFLVAARGRSQIVKSIPLPPVQITIISRGLPHEVEASKGTLHSFPDEFVKESIKNILSFKKGGFLTKLARTRAVSVNYVVSLIGEPSSEHIQDLNRLFERINLENKENLKGEIVISFFPVSSYSNLEDLLSKYLPNLDRKIILLR